MKICALQHVPFEGPANIENWAKEQGHGISKILISKAKNFPPPGEFDWLVLMGGPMNIYEEAKYPWLQAEKKFIEQAIRNGKMVLGICLGAQLIADVLGARVSKNAFQEIGWLPVKLTKEAQTSSIFSDFPPEFMAFHWHGDTLQIPSGAVKIAESVGCVNQAFEYEGRVVGLQFHLESTSESIAELIKNCGNEITEGRFIQNPKAMLSKPRYLGEIKTLLWKLLDQMSACVLKT